MSKPFFYRMDAAEFLSIAIGFSSDKERGKFMNQLALDLVTGNGTTPYAQKMISEATDYIDKKRQAGSKGGKQKASIAKAVLNHIPSIPIANNSNNNTTETKPKPIKPLAEYSSDFITFWSQYPKKTGKGAAWEVWKKVKPPIFDVINALIWQKQSRKWLDGFILDPERYIKKRCWEDEPDAQEVPSWKII